MTAIFSLCSLGFAQNGVPVDALKDNPYFASGSDFSDYTEEEKQQYEEKYKDENTAQYEDPSGENFYNADNWLGGGEAPGAAFGNPDLPENQDQSENQGEVFPELPEQPDEEDTDWVLNFDNLTEEELEEFTFGQSYYKSHWNLTLGWMPTFVVPTPWTDFADWFTMAQKFFIDTHGVSFSAEYAFGSGDIRMGPGLWADWSLIINKLPMYNITAHEADAGLYFFMQHPLDRWIFSYRAGLSGLALINLTASYTNGLTNTESLFIYPEIFAGASAKYYFFSFFGAGASLDFHVPLCMTENPVQSLYPRLQLTLLTAWRF